MAIIKCKMCGGDMEISEDKTVGICEYCGTSMTLPKVDNEQRAAAFNRGNHFRRIGEFDKALAVYERIVAEDNSDAEAHWCCALCRFGIEYVEDPATYEWLPTCHRASFDNFLEDVDYLAAVEYSDGITRRQYQKDAAKIAEVQRGILATSQKEEPFDVFICYKESDENGQRTVDSTLAQDIYYQLTDKGRRVFFARITLEDKGGAEYEPYIFAALNSAKVMVVVGTSAEHLNAVWVKNEWSRFLSLMKKDHSKLLLPCYRDMDPYDLPNQLSVLQSYDMSKIGFIQDLIRGIDKVLDAGKRPEPKQETVVVQGEGGGNITALIKRGNMALEDGDWSKADGFFDRVLDNDAECAEAYLGKALAEAKAASLNQLCGKFLPVLGQISPVKVEVDIPGHEEQEERLAAENVVPGYLEKEALQKTFVFDFCYTSRSVCYKQQMKSSLQRLDENKNLSRAERYASSALKAEIVSFKESIKKEMEQTLCTTQSEDEQSKKDVVERYEQTFAQWEQHINRMRSDAEAQREQEYQQAVALFEKQEYDQVLAQLQLPKLIEYKEAANYIARIQKVKENARTQFYASAETLLDAGDVANAAIMFGKARGYKDATQRSFSLWEQIAQRETISSRTYLTVGLRTDGTVLVCGRYKCDVSGWKNIIAVSAGRTFIVGLKSDGTVLICGECDINVSGWTDIVAVSAGSLHIVGLKSDGTVVAAGNNMKGQCEVSGWKNIVAICAGSSHTVGLKADGTVEAVGDNSEGQCEVSGWENIVEVCVGSYDAVGNCYTVGLKSDGTVVVAGTSKSLDISGWKNIVSVCASGLQVLGLKSGGTVVAAGNNMKGQCKVSGWKNIAAVTAGGFHSVGLKLDGTVVVCGDKQYGQCDVSDWKDIKVDIRRRTSAALEDGKPNKSDILDRLSTTAEDTPKTSSDNYKEDQKRDDKPSSFATIIRSVFGRKSK